MATMSSSQRRTILGWTPAVVVPVLVIAGVVVGPMAAGAVSLPDKTPAQVLAMIAQSHDLAYSATVDKVANLGLPAVDFGSMVPPTMTDGAGEPAAEDASGSAPGAASTMMLDTALEFVTGEHTARVVVDPEVGLRVQIQDRFAERNFVVNETEAWFYDSRSNVATRMVAPDPAELSDAQKSDLQAQFDELSNGAPAPFSTPAEAAAFVLDELDTDSTITLVENVRVANRAAYQLLVTPDESETLVRSIALAIDAETGLPLRVIVEAVGQDSPAFSISIAALDLSTPDAAQFVFTPPPGATVEDAPTVEADTSAPDAPPAEPGVDNPEPPVLVQDGWATIVEIPAGSVPAEFADSTLIGQVATSVDGGFALNSALATMFFADDGRVFVGTVPLSALQSAAAR